MKRLFLLLLLNLIPFQLFAQLSPGKLSSSHKELEGLKNCKTCHGIGQQIDAQNCLDCHKILAEQKQAKRGLHGKQNYDDCQACHVEHQGRDYELVYWESGKDKFDHSLTGYLLEGGHKKLKCEQCHAAKNIQQKGKFLNQKKNLNKTLLGLDQQCLNCHRDEHRGQVSSTCLNCHVMDQWKPAEKFNHAQTKFTLTGRHNQVQCDKCHAQIVDNKFPDDAGYAKFKNIPYNNCTDCHKDVHNNKFGRDCQKCHSTQGWKNVNRQGFDHSKTNYPLLGKHRAVSCEKCHVPGRPMKIARYQNCNDCHKNYHQGQFKPQTNQQDCKQCHTVDGFSPSLFSIDQHQKTQLPLSGGHLATPCVFCHVKENAGRFDETTKFSFNSTRCQECHKNPHGNQVDKYLQPQGCEYCHTVESWTNVSFDHNQTKFRLLGQHQKASCSGCHVKPQAGEKEGYLFTGLADNCQNCHRDIHLGQFKYKDLGDNKSATDCNRCHTPTDWLAEKFDHNRDSKFKIEGAHKSVECNQCHPQISLKGQTFRLFKLLRTECSSCHGSNKSILERKL